MSSLAREGTGSASFHIKMSSRVPRYQNAQKIGGFCNLLFASFPRGKALDGGMLLWFVSSRRRNEHKKRDHRSPSVNLGPLGLLQPHAAGNAQRRQDCS